MYLPLLHSKFSLVNFLEAEWNDLKGKLYQLVFKKQCSGTETSIERQKEPPI